MTEREGGGRTHSLQLTEAARGDPVRGVWAYH